MTLPAGPKRANRGDALAPASTPSHGRCPRRRSHGEPRPAAKACRRLNKGRNSSEGTRGKHNTVPPPVFPQTQSTQSTLLSSGTNVAEARECLEKQEPLVSLWNLLHNFRVFDINLKILCLRYALHEHTQHLLPAIAAKHHVHIDVDKHVQELQAQTANCSCCLSKRTEQHHHGPRQHCASQKQRHTERDRERDTETESHAHSHTLSHSFTLTHTLLHTPSHTPSHTLTLSLTHRVEPLRCFGKQVLAMRVADAGEEPLHKGAQFVA